VEFRSAHLCPSQKRVQKRNISSNPIFVWLRAENMFQEVKGHHQSARPEQFNFQHFRNQKKLSKSNKPKRIETRFH